jgi:peptidoglycan/xylan/chitin deacetylase (PgdA/CDA1 family)
VFAEFDCPVTTFVTSGFLDGALWFWWDRIEYVFHHTTRPALDVELNGLTLRYSRDPIMGYSEPQDDFTVRCKHVPESEKLEGIRRLATAAGVELPERPPIRYAPMSWDQVRTLEQRGMSFGPHTVTHPVLARATPDQSRQEIEQSWQRLTAEVVSPVPVFCYPNGQPQDYGDREISVLRALGFAGAVVGTPGYAGLQDFARPDGPFRVERFAYSDDIGELTRCASGFDRVTQLVRGVA